MGIDARLFEDMTHLDPTLFCPLCDNILQQPVHIGCPQDHVFCDACLASHIHHSNVHINPIIKCPACPRSLGSGARVKPSSMFRGKTLEGLISSLRVKCPKLLRRECSWQGKLSEMPTHLRECRHTESHNREKQDNTQVSIGPASHRGGSGSSPGDGPSQSNSRHNISAQKDHQDKGSCHTETIVRSSSKTPPPQNSQPLRDRRRAPRSPLSPPSSSPIQPHEALYTTAHSSLRPRSLYARPSRLYRSGGDGIGDSGMSQPERIQKTPLQSKIQSQWVPQTSFAGSPVLSTLPYSQGKEPGTVGALTSSTTADDIANGNELGTTQDTTQDSKANNSNGIKASQVEEDALIDDDMFNISMQDLMESFSFSLDQAPLTPSPQPGETRAELTQEDRAEEDQQSQQQPLQAVEQQQQSLSQGSTPGRRRRMIDSEEREEDAGWMMVEKQQSQQRHSPPQQHYPQQERIIFQRVLETPVLASSRQGRPEAMEGIAEDGEQEQDQYQSQASSAISDHDIPLGQRAASHSPPPGLLSLPSTLSASPRSSPTTDQQEEGPEADSVSTTREPRAAATINTVTFGSSLESFFLGQDAIFLSQEHAQDLLESDAQNNKNNVGADILASDTSGEHGEVDGLQSKRQRASTKRYIRRGGPTSATIVVAATGMEEDFDDGDSTVSLLDIDINATATASTSTSHAYSKAAAPSPPRPVSPSVPLVKNPILTSDLLAPFTGGAGRAVASSSSGIVAASTVARPAIKTNTGTNVTPASPKPRRVYVPFIFQERPPATPVPPEAAATTMPTAATMAASTATSSTPITTTTLPVIRTVKEQFSTAEQMKELSALNRDFAHRQSSSSLAAAPHHQHHHRDQGERYSLTQTTFYRQMQPGYIPVPPFRPRYQKSRKKKTSRMRLESAGRGGKFSPLVIQPTMTDDSDINLSDVLHSQLLSASQQEDQVQHEQMLLQLPASVEAV